MAQAVNIPVTELIRSAPDVLKGIHKTPVIFGHNLLNVITPDDDYLTSIIERAARAGPMHYNLSVIERDEQGNERWVQGLLAREGEQADGHVVLALIQTGRLWLQVEHLVELAPELEGAARQAYDELKRKVPGFSYFNLYSNLLISGPNARVTPHIDVAEVFLFHLRGHKRMTLWNPADVGIPDTARESIILREQLEDIRIPDEWLDKGFAAELAPGEGVNFPYMWPHAVDNLGDLNVSLQTEYHYPATMRRYFALYAQGLARRRLGMKVRNNLPSGAMQESLRAVPGLLAKALRLHSPKPRKVRMEFVVDAGEADGVRWLPEQDIVALEK